MIPLSAEQLDAARLLVRAVGDIPLGLVGAAALGFHLPLRTKTEDVDFVVATTPETTVRLLEAPGWKRHPRREHEWTAPNGARVDVVPASDAALRLGFLDWPESGNRMSLVGLRLVFEHAQRASLGHGLTLRVPYVPVIALLKMVAYRDRHDRTAKDLQHLAEILDGYPPDHDDRMFTHAQAVAGLTPEEARAEVLARELAALVDDAERTQCREFLRMLRTPTHGARMIQRMSQPADDRETLLHRRLDILERELGGG